MNYDLLLLDSFVSAREFEDDKTKHEFLADVFGITTYDGEMDKLFVNKALEVCNAITDKKTFEYIENKDNYVWYLTMVNLPFFSSKIEWGTSIRGAWWDYGGIVLDGICWAWHDDAQLDKLEFDAGSWIVFLAAINEFISTETD